MKQRRRAWGSLYEKSRNHWVLRWRENTPDGRKTRSETFVGTYAQADARLNEIRFRVAAPPCPTVGELWSDCALPQLAKDVDTGKRSKSTFAAYTAVAKAHVLPRWAKVPCTEVRALDIQKWLLAKSKATGNTALIVLRLCLHYAELYEIVPSNVAAKRYRMGEAAERRRDIYTVEELADVWGAVKGSPCEVPFILSAFAGLRVGEACGLRLRDIEWRDGYAALSVSVQSTRYGNDQKLKTKNAARTIALFDPAAARLKEIADALPDYAQYANDNGTGEPWGRKSVTNSWESCLRRSGVRRLPMQTLRPAYETHTHYRTDMPIEVLSKVMGHSQLSTTLGHYDRPKDELVQAQVKALM